MPDTWISWRAAVSDACRYTEYKHLRIICDCQHPTDYITMWKSLKFTMIVNELGPDSISTLIKYYQEYFVIRVLIKLVLIRII